MPNPCACAAFLSHMTGKLWSLDVINVLCVWTPYQNCTNHKSAFLICGLPEFEKKSPSHYCNTSLKSANTTVTVMKRSFFITVIRIWWRINNSLYKIELLIGFVYFWDSPESCECTIFNGAFSILETNKNKAVMHVMSTYSSWQLCSGMCSHHDVH